MPTYSRMAEGFLARCIDSVLNQTFENFEFIIVDDGSFDGSQELIMSHAIADARIVYIRHGENSGLPAIRTNEGILLARAAYVAFIFDDNVWDEDTLSVMMISMLNAPVDVLHANTRMIQSDNNNFDLGGWPLSIELLQHLNTIPNGAVLCARSFFEHYGLYDPHLSLRRVCDWDLWLRGIRLGAKFRHMNKCLGIELGPSSPVSLGNSVKMDFKVVFAYMTDKAKILQRSKALTPKQIQDYDVFEPLKIFPYIRDENEWKEFEKSVYKPFFDTHPRYIEATPVIHNRLYDLSESPNCINANGAVFKDKKRALIVCNRFTPFVEDWKSSFESQLNVIAITCSEWQASAFTPTELDLLILIDCTALFIKFFVEECREQNVAIGYVIMHGLDKPAPSSNPLYRLAFSSHDSVWETFKTDIYFPHFGMPWSEAEIIGARALMGLSHQTFVTGGKPGPVSVFDGINGVGLPYFPSTERIRDVVVDERNLTIDCVYFYLGNPGMLQDSVVKQVVTAAMSIRESFPVRLVILKDSRIPDELGCVSELQDSLLVSDEALLTWARHCRFPGCVVVPDIIVEQLEEYFLHFLEDELTGKDSALIRLSDLPDGAKKIDYEKWVPATRDLNIKRITERQSLTQGSCRLTQFACSGYSLLLQRMLLLDQSKADIQRIAILLNSPLLSGSEAYGLLLARSFFKLGYEVIICVPKIHGYGDVLPTDINRWLKANELANVEELNYGLGTQCFSLSVETCREHSKSFNEWLDKQGIKLVFCSGFIPDPIFSRSINNRPVFMALFQPWGYPLEWMTFLRDKITGLVSDSKWSASYWARSLAPPLGVVPSALPSQRLVMCSKTLISGPICVAIGGTLQPRKRQKEAIEAVRILRGDGYDIKLNIYGYALEIVSDYIKDLEAFVNLEELDGNVELHGLVEMEVIARNNHIILSTSIDESLPQTLLFSMAHGLIAVACPAGGISEIVIDEQTGYLCKGFSVHEIAASLKLAIDNHQKWPKIRATATTHLYHQHGELNVTKGLLSVLLEGLTIARSPGMKLFLEQTPQESAERRLAATKALRSFKNTVRPVIRKLLQAAGRVIGPYLSVHTKNRIALLLHRLSIL